MAYKAIKTKHKQKKLDARVLKFEVKAKKLESLVEYHSGKIEINALTVANKAIIDKIGDCPISCNNVVEALKEGDCFGIALEISRSEATIMDPSKLIVRKIIPTFISTDQFLESSLFKLKSNQDASGGFDWKKSGELALGLGREPISGVFPLYLFDEHWEISKHKLQQIFGFMCTLDPMGFAVQQYFTVPFLVLLTAFRQSLAKDQEYSKWHFALIQQTCTKILANVNELRKTVVNEFIAFSKDPAQRTADKIPSIPVLAAQILSYRYLNSSERTIYIIPER